MTRNLTERQAAILAFIREFAVEKGYPPTIPEIQEEFGIRSPNGVNNHIKALIRKGYLKRDSSRARALDIIGRNEGLPILGRVAAGQPILAEENLDGYLNFNDMSKSGNVFLLRVKGDSMVKAHIFDGDMVIVRMQQTVEPGEIGVAILNDEATVKRIYCDGNMVRLVPENDSMKPLSFTMTDLDFRIGGKVIGVYRHV